VYHLSKILRKVVHSVIPHHIGNRYEIEIADIAIQLIAIAEREPITLRHFAVMLFPFHTML
jgi:hypothetical protein